MICKYLGPFLILCAVFFANTGHGGVIYVSTNGQHVVPFDSSETAATNIYDALAVCEMYDEIEMGPGIFCLTNTLDLSIPVWIRGSQSSTSTVLYGNPLEIRHADILIQDITISGSCSYGVRFYADAVMERCQIYNSRNGGVYFDGAGILVNSMVYSNRESADDNSLQAGIYMKEGGKAVNCLIYDQQMGHPFSRASGAYLDGGGTLQNCTIVGNTAGSIVNHSSTGDVYVSNPGGGVYCRDGGLVKNCIIWQNIPCPKAKTSPAEEGDNWYFEGTNPVVINTCSWPLIPGIGNTETDPQFMDLFGGDYRLGPISPCIDAGYSGVLYDTDDDVAGNARVTGTTIDMGAYEVGPLLGTVEAVSYQEPQPVWFVFHAHVVGADLDGLVVDWDFDGDGNYDFSGASTLVVSNQYSTSGSYTAQCHFRNDAGEEFVATCPEIICTAYTNQYVSLDGTHQWPFDTWERAATNIQDAIDAAILAATNTTVMLEDGCYLIQDSLVITNPLVMTSCSGPEHTIIQMAGSNRCIYLDYPGSVVENISVINGVHTEAGGGVWCGTNTFLRNCVIESNCVSGYSNTYGGGVYGVAGSLITDCVIRHNSVNSSGADSSGGGCYGKEGVLFSGCIIQSNTAITSAGFDSSRGGVSRGGGCALRSSEIVESTVEYNVCSGQSGSQGGGLYADNTQCQEVLVCNNDAKGSYWPSNDVENFVPGSGGGAYLIHASSVENGTVYGNTSVYGAGIYLDDAALVYSSVYNNKKVVHKYRSCWTADLCTKPYGGTTTCCMDLQRNDGYGGGVYIHGYAEISNVQLYLNTAVNGGGIFIATGGVTVVNTTIANNSAESGAGIYNENGVGNVMNSVVYYNRNSPETKVEIEDMVGNILLIDCCCKSSSAEMVDCITSQPGFVDFMPLYEDNQFRPVTW